MKLATNFLLWALGIAICMHSINLGFIIVDDFLKADQIPVKEAPGRLVGIGCKGYNGAIFRDNEDQFKTDIEKLGFKY